MVQQGADISFSGARKSCLAWGRNLVWLGADILFGGEQESHWVGAEIEAVEALEATQLLLCYQLKSDLVFQNKQTELLCSADKLLLLL